MKKIVLTGPESCGKSTLAEDLAFRLETVCVPEFARKYISDLERDYNEGDLREIARGQFGMEAMYVGWANNFLICDTDLVTVKIWSQEKYGRVHEDIDFLLSMQICDLYLLCAPDLPWEPDPQRESPDDRHRLFQLYEAQLREMDMPYAIITGQGETRIKNALEALQKIV